MARLTQYKGKLTAEQVAEGINCAIRNASRLTEDARFLLDRGRFPTAASVAALSIEESGKAAILRQLAGASSDKDVRKCWRDYRSHTSKNLMWPLLDLVKSGARRLQDFAPLFDSTSDHPQILDQVKQIGFYSDCFGKAHWSEPAEVIDERLAQSLVVTAELLSKGREHVTAAEIDLWIKVVAPHLHGTKAEAEAALQEWWEQMQYLGLARAGENAMAAFIRKGL